MNDHINGHVPFEPDLSTTQSRERWAKAQGLPKGFMIISDAEMSRISQTVQASSAENLKYLI